MIGRIPGLILTFVLAGASCSRGPVRTGSGLVYEVVRRGSGARASVGQTVLIHEALTVDGKRIFSSWEKGTPVKFVIGANQVIRGVDEGVRGMRVGERRTLVVPPKLDGRPFDASFISPTSDRHYEVELVQILDPAKR